LAKEYYTLLCFTLQAQAEPETDEVYAQITLLPELDVSKF